jgi:hypothetical protein
MGKHFFDKWIPSLFKFIQFFYSIWVSASLPGTACAVAREPKRNISEISSFIFIALSADCFNFLEYGTGAV